MLVQLGGVTFELSARDERTAAFAAKRYGSWTIDDETSRPARWRISSSVVDDFVTRDAPWVREVHVERSGETIRFDRADFRATVDLRTREATVTHYPDEAALHSLMRVMTSLALVVDGGLLLHASSVVDEGRAFVFAGRSGAGKTTIARLGGARAMLNDECSALVPEAGRFDVCSTPFWGEHRPDREERVRAPLARLFFLIQDSACRRAPVPRRDALRRLLSCVFFFGGDRLLAERILDTSSRLLAATSYEELRFRPDPSVWTLIHGC